MEASIDPSPGPSARVHLVDPGRIDPAFIESALTAAEREQAGRFHFPADSLSWSATRAALRGVLAAATGVEPRAVELQWEAHGKPTLAGLHFNLSHTRGLAVILVADHGPVGIDLEHRERAGSLLGCVDAFCHPLEIDRLPAADEPRGAALLKTWVHKEALLKAIGTGLSYDPRQLRLDGDSGLSDTPLPGLDQLKRLALTLPDAADYLVAAAVPRSIHAIQLAPLPEGIDMPPASVRGCREAPPP